MKLRRTMPLISFFLCCALLLSACQLPLDMFSPSNLYGGSSFTPQPSGSTSATWGPPEAERRTIPYSDMQYVRPDFDAMSAEISALTTSLQKAGSYEEVSAISEELDVLFENFNTMYTLAMLVTYTDSSDTYYEEEYRLLEEKSVDFSLQLNDFYEVLLGGPYAQEFRDEIGEYEYAAIEDMLLLNSPEVEQYQKERNELNADYNDLITSLGEGDYDANVDVFADLYVRMIELDKLTAQTLGFSSPAHMYYTSYNRDYTPEEGLALCESSKRYFTPLVPVAASGGYVSAPVSLSSALEQMPITLEKIHPQLSESFDFMLKYGLYDCAADPNKQSGIAFSTELSAYDTGFLYSYWEDDFYSLSTLTHEFGHFYEYWLHYDDSIVFNLDIAETYSQALELLMIPFYGDFIGKENVQDATMQMMQDFVLSIFIYQSLLEEFQHRVYALEAPDSISIGRIYADLLDEYGLWSSPDENGADNSWYRVTHLFDAPFYTISYVTSAVAALQIWSQSREDYAAAVDTYLAMIHTEQNQPFTSLLEEVGLHPVHSDKTLHTIATDFAEIFGV